MDILYDLRFAARSLRRSLFFTATTVLTLGLGIGVVTALFAVVKAVLLHPIAVDQDRVVRIWKYDVERNLDRHPLSYPEFRAWREQTRTFKALAAINYANATSKAVMLGGEASPVALTPVSADFFAALHGGEPLLGRWFQRTDEYPGAPLVGVVSERFWRRAAAADPSFVGRRLTWAGDERTVLVVGVAPPEFDYPLGTDIWVPIARLFGAGAGFFHLDVENRRFIQFEVIGRLAPGVSLDEGQAELSVLHRAWTAQFPSDARPMRVVVEPLLDTVVGDSRQVLVFLFAAAGLVFVIAGVNVAALLLMRAAGRRRELAVRVALGASHARLARQTVIEGLLLGGLSAGFGLLLARLFLGIVQLIAPGDTPRIEHAVLDLPVLGFCIIAVVAWVLALGTAPIWSHRRLAIAGGAGALELSFRGIRGTRGLRTFTIAEVAAAVVVSIGAGLLVRSFVQLQRVERGFNSNNLAVIELLLPESRYPDARSRLAFYNQLLPQITAIPGVVSASPVHMRPGTGLVGLSVGMRFEGQTPEEAAKNPWATWEPVTPSYFPTLGIPITRGRGFTDADSGTGAPVAIVSEAMARRYWPGQDPIGKRLQFTSQFPWVTVVGVAADVRYRELTRSWMTVYFPAAQFFFFAPGSLVVRVSSVSAPEALVPAIRQAIRTQEPHVALESIDTMDRLLARELSRPRAALSVAALFATMATILAAVGVYGVLSYEVSQRRRELAVRSALGASPARIFRAVVLRSVMVGAAGASVGIVTAFLATRSLRALLFEVGPTDPVAFLVGAAALIGIVLLASYLPARRAARADPAAALRTE